MLKTYQGSCHCGKIRYEADIDLSRGTSKCNCTFCLKARSWKSFVQPDAFRLVAGGDEAVGYRKHAQTSLKYFCPACGVRTHELGNADYMGGPFVGVFINTLDDAAPEEFAAAPVTYSDGLNNNWQNAPAETRYL